MIEASGLTKRYGPVTAVDEMSFTVEPGRVTGFLGPNGAGKSTTMRMTVGLDAPTKGAVTVNGKRYVEHGAPLSEVGVLLDAKAVHPGRTARNHLRAMAATHGISRKRVDEVIELAGLPTVADKRVGGFSLGMGQRLGIAAAMLGDPQTLILDEPVNGLDPEGVLWVRRLVRSLAEQGRTVFLSSHLMSEMSVTADHVIVVGRGKVLANAPIADLIAAANGQKVKVTSPQANRLEEVLRAEQASVVATGRDSLEITGLTAAQVGEAAAEARLALHELTATGGSLEDAYLQLTADDVEYRSTPMDSQDTSAPAHQHEGGSR